MSDVETGLHYPIKLNELPPSWSVGYVGQFADTIQPGFASGKHNKGGAGIPHLRPMNVDQDGKISMEEVKFVSPDKDKKRLQVGDVLFNNTNSPVWVGKTAYVGQADDLAFSNHMTRVVFNEDVSPKYGALQLHYLWMSGYFLHRCTKHVNQASISSKTLADTVPFVVPESRDQQDQIVAEIEKQFSRLDEAVSSLKRVKANLKRYKAAVLKAAVEGKLTEEWRKQNPDVEPASKLLERILAERPIIWEKMASVSSRSKKYVEPGKVITDDLPELPTSWVWVAADQISDFVTKGTTPKKDKLMQGDGDIQFLKVYNLTFDGSLNSAYKPAFISRETHDNELARSKVFTGDVLINIVGPPLGQVSVVPGALGEANINQAIGRFRPIPPLSSEYFAVALRSSSVMSWAIARAKTTAGQSNLTLAICRELPIPLPPLDEQVEIVSKVNRELSLIKSMETSVNVAIHRAEILRQSTLSTAFHGGAV